LKSRYRSVAGLLVAGALAAGCGKQENGRAADETVVRIGSVAPLTGPQAHLGKDNDNGARLAMDDINAAGLTLGGKKARIELISEDDQADPRIATIVAQKFVDNGVAGVIGHLNSGATIPASKIYHDAGIPQISPSATAIAYTAQGFETAFRVMTNDEQQGKVLGEFAVNTLGAKRIAIIDDRTAYGQGLADEFEKSARAAGAQIVTREFTSDRSTDFMAILTAIKGKDPQLVFYGGMDAQGGPIARQMKELGLGARMLGADGMQTAEFLKLAGTAADGVVASSPGLSLSSMPEGQTFKQKFNARYGEIQNYAPYAYDAVQVMVAAMRRADSADPRIYLPEIARTDLQGVTGHIRFDAKGDIAGGYVTLYQVKNGAWQVLETIESGK
jgi:branched-chain amino acid transport system substrate-binding protein